MKFDTPPDAGSLLGMVSPDTALLLIPLLVILFAVVWFYPFRRRRSRDCRWKKDRRRHGTALIRWQCVACGVDAFTIDGKPPKQCKREFRETRL